MKVGNRRSLKLEGLEDRLCFAVDIGELLASLDVPTSVVEIVRHNYDQPTDVNVDGHTSPLDALNVINELNSKSGTFNASMMTDTNGDQTISPIDALIVINHLNDRSSVTPAETTIAEPASPADTATEDLIRQIIVDSQMAEESMATLLGRLRDAGLVDLGSFDPESINLEWWGSHADVVLPMDLTSVDLSSVDSSKLNLGLLGAGFTERVELAGSSLGRTYDPTDDNGNGFFLPSEDSEAHRALIDTELRQQLKLDDSAAIQVAVFAGGNEVSSGTWRYLTEEGISIWGNWRKTPDELRLFLSNVEEENRIYGQYPDGSFLYFSWLDKGPVGFYFTPIGKDGVENPVPIERYNEYFDAIPGAEATAIGGFIAFAGDWSAFEGVQPIEGLLSDLFAIQRQWNDELAASGA